MTQAELGSVIGVSQRAVADYERKKYNPKPATATRIGEVFEMNTEDIWNMFYRQPNPTD